MSATTRDYAAEYLAACKEARADGIDLATRGKARNRAARIARAADKAGVRLDEIGLDEQARVELYPTPAPAAPEPATDAELLAAIDRGIAAGQFVEVNDEFLAALAADIEATPAPAPRAREVRGTDVWIAAHQGRLAAAQERAQMGLALELELTAPAEAGEPGQLGLLFA